MNNAVVQNVSLHCTVDPDCEHSDALECGVGDEHPRMRNCPGDWVSAQAGAVRPSRSASQHARAAKESSTPEWPVLAGEHRRGHRDSPMALEVSWHESTDG